MGRVKKEKHRSRAFNPTSKSKRLDPKSFTVARRHAVKSVVQTPTIPFDPEDRILLVGEGDFSFAHSLATHHFCTSLLATSYDSVLTVLEKYPQAASHIEELEGNDHKVVFAVDATALGKPNGGGKDVRQGSWDRIIFNFPHVGGLTKDVNRQVRANQELLVGFFTSALPILASNGAIVVTVFEGEPYELWNIRDLARHVGLKVGRSFRFQGSAYPGYSHARTLGNIEGGGAWKGEDRSARTYMLELKDEEPRPMQECKREKKKRKRDDTEDDSEDGSKDD